ncbi:MAG: XRE family transcriptional regulator [Endomicrobium sp.]|jgi:transcriptional regulator with XRE-family HTH domain|nr:XRE family transcriptional regulator [Endomicrobium sp.]
MYTKKLQIGRKIKEARKSVNLTQTELAQKIGYMRNSIAQYEIGKLVPSIKVLEKIAHETNKSLNYFLYDKQTSELREKASEYNTSDMNTVTIPIYNAIPTSYPDFSQEEPLGFEGMPRALSKGAKFAIVCDEEDMQPSITKYDICYIKPTSEAIDGKIMLVKTNNGFKIRKIQKSKNEIKLISDNTLHKNDTYKVLEVIGLVVKIGKDI